MKISRRELIVLPGAAAAGRLLGAPQAAGARVPWYAKMRRCGQINFNERDPIELDINAWLDYWTSLKLDALLLNAGGIVAFYPTKTPYHHRSQYLGDHDLFGDFTKAAKSRGLRVVARLDCNWGYEDAVKAHPEWFERRPGGEPVRSPEATWLYRTCMFSPYFTEQIPAIIREVNSLYDVDAFFTNGWPSTGRPPVCYCESCKRLGKREGPKYYQQHLDRVLEVWKLWDSAAKQKKWDSVYIGNLGGGIRAVTNLKKLAEVAGWFNADHQGRAGTTPIWDCAQQGRVAYAVMKGRTTTNVTGAYANSRPLWRHTSKSPAEATLWMAQTTASGMVPWYHWLGGAPEDLRWRETGRRFFQWHARHERHFINRRSIANLGVVFSERTNAFYRPPDAAGTRVRGGAAFGPPGGADPTEFLQGLYYALLEGRFFFDFVHEDDLVPETLQKYAALLLPNVALLSDEQCRQLQNYVRGGGSLLATFETGRYDQSGQARSGFGLGDLFGIEPKGPIQGPQGNSFYARIERPHEILRGFENTRLLPGAEYRQPVEAAGSPALTVIPPFPAFPPEMVYTSTPHTSEPAVVIREKGASRLIYFPGDIGRSCWRSGNTDLSLLLQNSVRWLLREAAPAEVAGEGIAEVFAWQTEPGFAIHIVNYNNPNMMRGWMRRSYPLGPQQARLELPEGVRISRVEALRAPAVLPHRQTGRRVEFTIPKVGDYEVAALTA
ncbi:MAG TPA: alpha-amylase family protein [Bryobacterales bacterium]|nr:alpha-amylase family protein [Bryobacterales bacterium]